MDYKKICEELYSRGNKPIYKHLDDLLIIGVSHGMDAMAQPHKLKKFLREIRISEHLFLESTKDFHKYRQAKIDEKNSYEVIAVREHNGSVYFLEDGIDVVEMASKYGVRKDLFGLYDNLVTAILAFKLNMSLGPIHSILIKKKQWVSYDQVDIADTLKKIERTIKHFPYYSWDILAGIGGVFQWYLASLRNFEILGPKTKSLSSQLAGRKTEIVGAAHVGHLIECLRDKATEPVMWDGFVAGLEPVYVDVIGRLETELFPKPTQNRYLTGLTKMITRIFENATT